VSFSAAGSPEEAADRLARGTRRLILGSAVAGRVTVTHVALRRHRAFFDNSFAPVFRREFAVGCTLLRGSALGWAAGSPEAIEGRRERRKSMWSLIGDRLAWRVAAGEQR